MRYDLAVIVTLMASGALLGAPALSQSQPSNQRGNSGTMASPYAYPGGMPSSGLRMSPYAYRTHPGVPGAAAAPYGYPGAPLVQPYPYPGQIPLSNQPGFGYYNRNPYAPAYPVYPAPGASIQGRIGSVGLGAYWRAPSGYYYPFNPIPTYTTVIPPVIVVDQGAQKPAEPSISEMFKDMRSYLDEPGTKDKYRPDDYAHLSRRLRDLSMKYSSLLAKGPLDHVDEENLRKDLGMLSGDIARRARH